MAVLLIGSTGNGKSTLGNFLLNPDKEHIFGDCQTFTTARTNMPETQCVLSSTIGVDFNLEGQEDSELTIIDTPGIFEDDDKDFEHMINIIKALHTVGEIRVCIFVVKFSSKIDTPYKASVKYYSKLLPHVFDSNLIIVMTDYASDKRSKRLRALQGIEEDEIRRNIVTELVAVSNVKYTPKVFAIDCLPINDDGEEDINLSIRESIIRHILTFSPRQTKNLKVAKTDAIIASDKLMAAKLEGEAEAYKDRLQQTSKNASTIKTLMHDKAKILENAEKEIVQLREDLQTKDTKKLVEAAVWSANDRWKCFRFLSRRFQVESEWPIQDIRYWTNDKCRWVSQNKVTDHRVEGLVKGKFMRGLYAEVKLYVYNCDKFQEDVEKLKGEMVSIENKLSAAKQVHEDSQREHSAITEEVEKIVGNIYQKKVEIDNLLSEYLTMEECLVRYQK